MASNDEQRSATTILTTAAQSIAARLIANETTAKFTKAEISTTNLFNQSVTELQVLTSLDNVQQTADINTVTVINNNTVNVNVAIDQTKAPNNYQMNSVGLFAVDGDGKEVLYSVTVLKDPVYIHQDAMGSALGIDLETVVGQASNVEISVNPAGAVTNEILKAALADYVKTDYVKSLIPATVIDGSKPADFKEAVTLEKGAVDGTGNAIATTKNVSDGDAETLKSAKEYADTKVSGKADDSTVVHTADMRKPASDVAGIEEVNAKQDKIGYTPADDSKVAHNSGNEEIAGQKTFDTAPIDKATGNPYVTKADVPNGYYGYTVDLTDAKYDRNKWYYVDADGHQLGSLGSLSYFSLEAPLYSGINVPYGSHTADGTHKDASARQAVLYSQGGWGAYNRKLTVIEDQTDLTTDGKRLLTFAVPSDNNLNYAFYARGGLKINIVSDLPGLTWTPHTDTFVENYVTISVLNDAPDPKSLGLDDDHTFWALPMSQVNQQLKSYVTAVTPLNSTDMNTVLTAGFYQLNSGTNGMPNADRYTVYQALPLSSSNGVQIAYQTNNTILGMRSWNNWNQFTSWIQLADDSKVAHLSGANNFDTVPTVNNNPVLLASSLPSDLARTGSDQEFTGKNTFDTAPIDKTTGNPYITKDGIPAVPSTLADTTKDANFTGKLQKSGIDVATKSDVATAVSAVNANMVHRNPDTGVVSEPTDFTNLTVNGGKSVATSDDLKSLEASAWRVLDNKYITAFTKYNTSIKVDENSLFLVKIDEVNKRVYMFFTILGNFVENSSIYIDLTSIVKNLSFPSYHLYYLEGNTASSTADGSIVGNRICFKIQIYDTTVLNSKYSSYMVNANDAGWIYSSCFVSYDELV